MATLGGVSIPGSATSAGTLLPSSVGGTKTGSVLNQGKTPISVQKQAIKGETALLIKDTTLASSYVQSSPLITTDVNLADWYRYGKPGSQEGQLYETLPRMIDPGEEEPAAIRVFAYTPKQKIKYNGVEKDGEVEIIPPFTKFILEGMSEGHAERTQIIETFGHAYVFFFGERPPMYNYTGTLINTRNINWRADFQFYYDNFLRGTKCVENNARVIMTYGGRQVEGFFLNFQTTTDAALEAGVKVSFQLLITNRLATLGLSRDFGSVTQGSQQFQSEEMQALIDGIAGKEGKGLAASATSEAFTETQKSLQSGSNLTGPVSTMQSLVA